MKIRKFNLRATTKLVLPSTVTVKHLGREYQATVTDINPSAPKFEWRTARLFVWALDLAVEVPLMRVINRNGGIVI